MKNLSKVCSGVFAVAMLASPLTAMASTHHHKTARHAVRVAHVMKHQKRMSWSQVQKQWKTNYKFGHKIGSRVGYWDDTNSHQTMMKLSKLASKSAAFRAGFLKAAPDAIQNGYSSSKCSRDAKKDLNILMGYQHKSKAYQAGWYIDGQHINSKLAHNANYYKGYRDSLLYELGQEFDAKGAYKYSLKHNSMKNALSYWLDNVIGD